MAALPFIAAGAAIVSGVVGAVGAMQQARATSDAAEYNAKVQDYNKQVSDRNAQTTIQIANADMEEKRRENRRQLGAIRAAYGASGLALAGSPLDVLEDAATEQELDVQKIGYKGEIKAIGYKDEAVNFAAKAQLSRMEAENARKAGPINAITALLGGVTKAGLSMSPGTLNRTA